MATTNVGPSLLDRNLCLLVPPATLGEPVAETPSLRPGFPEILVAVIGDQDPVGTARRLLRAEHTEWLASAGDAGTG